MSSSGPWPETEINTSGDEARQELENECRVCVSLEPSGVVCMFMRLALDTEKSKGGS